ncbi:aminopeptidase [Flavobacterium sp.]|uniref:aminopeptidase n=1 Tax=Flavobacterium sp. TaxID=239 RepID=UPI003528ED7E
MSVKVFNTIILFAFIHISLFAQHTITIESRINFEEKTIAIKQDVLYVNNSPDTLRTIMFNDWNNAFSSKSSALAKRFSDEFVRAFHLAPDADRGYTAVKNCIDENFNQLQWNRPNEIVDLLELSLHTPILPYTSQKITLIYNVKIPNDKFTRYGFDDNQLYFKDFLLVPCKYENRGFIKYSNENLDDNTNALCNYTITTKLPTNYTLATNLSIIKNDANIYTLEGEKIQSVALIINKETNYKSYTNEFIEVSTNLENKRINEIQKVILIDRITRFTQENLGSSLTNKILVSQEDYDRQPFYGLNQMPAFLNPFPNELMFELKFLKTYLYKYLKANLQLNARNESWIYDGIQVYTMMQYMDQYYPDMKLTGNVAKLKILKAYNIINLDFNQQYNYLYMLMARKNLDQAVGLPKNKLIKFNEQIANKYRSGLNFKYLDSYLENEIVANSIKEFLNNNRECESSKYDLEYILKKNTSKNIDWFFETLVNSRDLIDFKFGKVKKTDEKVTVTIKNITQTNVPISFYELKNDSIVHKEWITNITTDTTLVFNRNKADKITLNYLNEIPEYNLRNNWKSLKGFLFNHRPLKFNFFRDLEEPYYNQIFYVPEFEYNLYDGIAVGMNINNKSLLNKPFTFSATPFYSPNTGSLVGKASLSYENNIRTTGKLYKVKYAIRGSEFHYAPNARYTNLSPTVQFYLRDPDFRSNKKEYILLKQLYAKREQSIYITDENTEDYNIFNAKYGNFQSEGTKHYSFLTDLQVAGNFGKLAAEVHYRKLFEDNRQITLRFFAGTFLYRDTNSDYYSFGLDRPTDYMFEHNLLGRSESNGLFSQQYVYAEGGFKSKLNTRFANQWMATANVAFNIWNWIQVYGDVGVLKNNYQNPQFVYDSGIHLNLVPDYFELFFPVYSSNGFEINQPHYNEKIRFVITLSPKTLISLFTRKWF